MPPDRLDHTRKFLIADIYKAFDGVTRKGGVSWTEADAIDSYAIDEECEAARALDKDTSWTELVNDSRWNPDAGGGFSFLDAIGFRYYLPAAMIRAIGQSSAIALPFALRLSDSKRPDLREWQLDKWSLLNRDQRRCVIRFLQYMDEINQNLNTDKWQEALDSYWSTALDP